MDKYNAKNKDAKRMIDELEREISIIKLADYIVDERKNRGLNNGCDESISCAIDRIKERYYLDDASIFNILMQVDTLARCERLCVMKNGKREMPVINRNEARNYIAEKMKDKNKNVVNDYCLVDLEMPEIKITI